MAKIPEQIGKYKILSLLGSGGSSIVYLGLHPTLKRKVVLKKLNLRGKKSFYERFVQEAALMMDLNHDHIVKVYDHFKEGSRHYMVMEFVEGASLDQIIEQSGPLQGETIRYVLRCCCKALSYIHSRNIIHRDIKPSNIFISSRGEVKLGDFGIAMLDNPDETESTEGHSILGTPSYMAPEQFNPHGKITPRTDIYALGVSYFELLTGQKLFNGESLEELKNAVLKGRHIPLYSVLRDYGFSSWKIIRRSTFRAPILRYRRSESLLRVISGFRMNDSLSIEELSHRTGGRGNSNREMTGSFQKSFDFADVMGHKRKSSRIIPLLLISIVLVLGLASAAAWKTGAIYKYILPDRYGSFTVSIVSKNQGESFPFESLLLFCGSETMGTLYNSDDLKDFRVFYKKSDYYRMMIRWGNRVEWRSFFLSPLSSQKSFRNIELQAPALISQPVELKISVKDALTGQDLDIDGSLFIQGSEGAWLTFDEGIMIFSGATYNFKLALSGYYEIVFSRTLSFYENELLLNEELLPLPGRLSVHHNLERLILEVNGHKKLYIGGSDSSVLRFGSLDMEGESWLLPPGVYQLQWSGRFRDQLQKLTVRSEEIVVYRITLDEQGTPVFGMDRKDLEIP
jgi:eukaryotic-like serine/threonine-protein kinase